MSGRISPFAGLVALLHALCACGGVIYVEQKDDVPPDACFLEKILDQSPPSADAVIIMGNVSAPLARLREAVEAHGGTVRRDLHGINGIAASFAPPAGGSLDRLAADPLVRAVVPDDVVYAYGADDPCEWWFPDDKRGETVPWGVARLGAPLAWPRSEGHGVRVAVIDTGIDVDHPDLVGNLVGGINLISGDGYTKDQWNDDNGHGTHVAGTIAAAHDGYGVVGVAPEADLIAVKVLNKQGFGMTSDIVAALEWVTENNIQVVNMSLGSRYSNAAMEEACDAAERAGILLVAAAGNAGDGDGLTDDVGYPAKYASVLAVGAVDEDDLVASFSSDGPDVEISAHGVNVMSDWKFGALRRISGTSMASPHIAGAAALLFARFPDTATNACIREALVSSALDAGDPGRDAFYGAGIADVQAAEEAAAELCGTE